MLLCSLPLWFPLFVGDLDSRDCLDAWVGLNLLSSISEMGVKFELLHWEPLFLMLPSFWSLVQLTSGSSMLNLGETLLDMSLRPTKGGGSNRLSGASCAA